MTKPIRFIEIVDVPKLQLLLDSLCKTIGIANAVIDTNGVVIASAGWQDVCTKFHRVNPDTCQRCIASDTSLVASMTQGVPYAIYDCLNGLTDTAAPIHVEGQHVANVFTGQFFTQSPDLDFFRQQAIQFGFDERSYLEAVKKVPVLSRERVRSITELYAQIAQLLAKNGADCLHHIEVAQALTDAGERALLEREEQFRRAIETSTDGYMMTDLAGNIFEANHSYAEISGYTREELLRKHVSDIEVIDDHPEIVAQRIQRLIEVGFDSFESEHRKKDGQVWPVHVTLSYSPLAQGRIFAFFRDLTVQKRAEEQLRLTQFVMDNADVEIYWLDKNARIHYVNRKVCETLGYSLGELTSLSIPDIDPLFPVATWDLHWEALRQEKSQSFETVHKRKNGTIFPVEVHANYVRFGEFEYNVAFTRDISERKEWENKLTFQAHTDYLTGVANRRYISELIEAELLRCDRYQSPLSILLIDIDQFKRINDTYGHKVGDLVLQKLAWVCNESLREVDTVGRWGGEEFVVLLPETNSQMALEVAERLRRAQAETAVPCGDGQVLHFTVSIGCASRLKPGDTLDKLVAYADKALYEAKGAGRNRVAVAVQ